MSLYDITLGKTNIYNIDADECFKGDSPILENEKVISINHYTRHAGNISFVAKYSDKKVFGLIINSLSDFEIPSPWISIGVDSNNITLSFEKILGKCGFDLEEFEDNEGKHVFSYKQLNTGLFLVLVIDNERLGIFLGTEEMKNRSYHEFVSRDFQDEEDDNDVEVPSCPKCDSGNVEDDGSGYLQYKCNDCGNIWGHDDKEECPECGSRDTEDDGTDYLQYECNNCGHIWGDDESDDDDNDVEVPSCPKCGSDDVKDDGSGYLQYECNDCGNIWGHDDNEECPECGSHDIEDDGTDYLQYECNNCGHVWGDDESDDDDNDVEVPSCPKCGSDDVKDDGSG